MRASRLRIWLRRGFAVALVAALAAVAWFVFVRDDDDGDGDEAPGRRASRARPTSSSGASSTEEQVDQVLLLGFDGVDAGAPIVAELRAPARRRARRPAERRRPELLAALARAGRADGRIPPLIVAAQEGGVYRSFPELPPAERAIDIGDLGAPERGPGVGRRDGACARRTSASTSTSSPSPTSPRSTARSGGRAFSDDSAVVGRADRRGAPRVRRDRARLRAAPLPGARRRLAGHGRGPGDGQPRRGLARRARPRAVPRRGRRGRAGDACSRSRSTPPTTPVTPGALTPEVTPGVSCATTSGSRASRSPTTSAAARSTATYRRAEAAVAALRAGADLLQIALGRRPERACARRSSTAVESGELRPERLAEAAGRVLELKRELGLIE